MDTGTYRQHFFFFFHSQKVEFYHFYNFYNFQNNRHTVTMIFEDFIITVSNDNTIK